MQQDKVINLYLHQNLIFCEELIIIFSLCDIFSIKMKRFAKKYFDNDIKRLTYCMKDVYNWKIYTDLFDSYTKVDYTQLLETEDNTVGIEEISCAGGACLI